MSRPRRRWTLATRISLVSVAIAVITAVIAGALAIGLIGSASTNAARRTFGDLADVVATGPFGQTDRGVAVAARRLNRALQGLDVRYGVIGRNGRVRTQFPLVRQALTSGDEARLSGGQAVSAKRSVAGTTVFVEGRPLAGPSGSGTGTGAIVLVQREADATAQSRAAVRRLILALLVAGALAAALGLFVAWRLARPLRRTAAAAHALAAGHRDVTLAAQGPAEVVEVSEAINTLAAALRASEGRQREFLLSVSHDLRTPLTAIGGYAESLAEGVIAPEQTAHVGRVLHGEAQRLERLVGDLLDLARLGARDFRIDVAIVDVVGVLHSAAPVWSDRCAQAGVRFALEVPDHPLIARTDAARLRQVLDGLFDNALRVAPAGTPIVLAARAEPAAVIAEVRDGGPGLTDDDLVVAFEQGALYERYRGVRQVGTGLGLAIVHGLVSRLGGQVEAGHAAEGGARFTVRLPPG